MSENVNLRIFENEKFGQVRTMMVNNEPWFVATDVCKALNIDSTAVRRLDEDEKATLRLTQTSSNGVTQEREVTGVNEPGLYSLILGSRKPEAKTFKRWITHEVIPQIRQTGGYIPIKQEETDEEFLARALIVAHATLKKKDELIARQKKEIEHKDKEIEYKEDVIVGLVDDIDLATKRQRINQIVKHGVTKTESYQKRWSMFYVEFEKKYHMNLSLRLEKHKKGFKPQLKNKIDYIERGLKMIPQAYEICCKLFENDVAALMEEWSSCVVDY